MSNNNNIRVKYIINKTKISCTVIIVKNNIIQNKFDFKGSITEDGLVTLANEIVLKIIQ